MASIQDLTGRMPALPQTPLSAPPAQTPAAAAPDQSGGGITPLGVAGLGLNAYLARGLLSKGVGAVRGMLPGGAAPVAEAAAAPVAEAAAPAARIAGLLGYSGPDFVTNAAGQTARSGAAFATEAAAAAPEVAAAGAAGGLPMAMRLAAGGGAAGIGGVVGYGLGKGAQAAGGAIGDAMTPDQTSPFQQQLVQDYQRRQDLANQGKPIASYVAGVPLLGHAIANGAKAAWDNTLGALGSQVAEGFGYGGGAAPAPAPAQAAAVAPAQKSALEHMAAGHDPVVAAHLATPYDQFMASLGGMSHHQGMALLQAMSGLPNQNEQMIYGMRADANTELASDLQEAAKEKDAAKRAALEGAARTKHSLADQATFNKSYGAMAAMRQGMI